MFYSANANANHSYNQQLSEYVIDTTKNDSRWGLIQTT